MLALRFACFTPSRIAPGNPRGFALSIGFVDEGLNAWIDIQIGAHHQPQQSHRNKAVPYSKRDVVDHFKRALTGTRLTAR